MEKIHGHPAVRYLRFLSWRWNSESLHQGTVEASNWPFFLRMYELAIEKKKKVCAWRESNHKYIIRTSREDPLTFFMKKKYIYLRSTASTTVK